MPIVQQRNDVTDWILSEAKKYLARKPRTGIHVSDLLLPRKAYWGRVMPRTISDAEALYFMAGRAHEETVVALAGLGRYRKSRGEWSGTVEDRYQSGDGIKYEVDVVVPTGNEWTPIEFKTNRRPTIIAPEAVEEQYSYYLRQLGSYVAITGSNHGYLAVLHLMARNLSLEGAAEEHEWLKQSKPMLLVYQIDWADDELDAIKAEMQEGRRLLELAWAIQDHTILKECEAWMCGKVQTKASDPVCPNCGRVYVVGEEKPDGSKRGVLKYCEDCKVSGKRVELTRDVQQVFVPSCPFWSVCLPSQWEQFHTN